MSSTTSWASYSSKIAGKPFQFMENWNLLVVGFKRPKLDSTGNIDQDQVDEYKENVLTLVQHIDAHQSTGDITTRVVEINPRWGFALVEAMEGYGRTPVLKELESDLVKDLVTFYMPSLTDMSHGNYNTPRFFVPDRIVINTKSAEFLKTVKIDYPIGKKEHNLHAIEFAPSGLDEPYKKLIWPATLFKAIEDYNKMDEVFAEPYEVSFSLTKDNVALAEPQDKHYYNDRMQWGLRNTTNNIDIRAYTAWNTQSSGTINESLTHAQIKALGNYGHPDVVVALIDYGIGDTTTTYGHGDYQESPTGDGCYDALMTGANFTGVGGTSTLDSSTDSHGTHMAGIIAARRVESYNLYKKIVGIAPRCRILPLKINTATFDANQAVSAINFVRDAAVADTSKKYIICIGWECGDNSLIRQALTNAWNATGNGVLIVCAAGNSGASSPVFPAKHPNSIPVGAFDQNDTKWSFSNYGNNEASNPTIFAPGVSIRSTIKGNTWGDMTGSSCAAAFIAGAAAAIWSRAKTNNIVLTNQNVKDKILQNTDPLSGSPGFVRHNLQEAFATIRF